MPAIDPALSSLRIALFSGNYNYVRDGANQALNRLVGYLLRQGAQVRVYAPKVEEPAFPATGDLVGVPSVPFPGRAEYRFPLALSPRVRRDLAAFAPNVVHVSSPDVVAHRARPAFSPGTTRRQNSSRRSARASPSSPWANLNTRCA